MSAAWFEGLLFFAAVGLTVWTVLIAARQFRSPGGPPPSGRPGPTVDACPPTPSGAPSGPGHPTTRGGS